MKHPASNPYLKRIDFEPIGTVSGIPDFGTLMVLREKDGTRVALGQIPPNNEPKRVILQLSENGAEALYALLLQALNRDPLNPTKTLKCPPLTKLRSKRTEAGRGEKG